MPFVKTFSHLFYTRSDSHTEEIRAYLFGLLQAKSHAKNMERMEEVVPNFNYQSVNNTISDAPWDHQPVMDEVALRAHRLLGGAPRTRLVLDDSSFSKKGDCSVGVARQHNGRLGKVDNCQNAVCASLAAGQISTLVDIRLYLPESWCSEPKRCLKAGIPEEKREFKTKPEIALEIIHHQRKIGVSFDITSMDSGYGSNHPLLHRMDASGETFVAEVHCDQHVWAENPWPHYESSRPGKSLKNPRPSQPSQRADAMIAAEADTEWQRLKIRDSDQGWVEVSYLHKRIYVLDGDVAKVWWLLAWENPDERAHNAKHPGKARIHYALSNASASEDPRVLVKDGMERNVVERNFRDAKTEVGMADYQTRGWLAWYHHMSLVMLAMLFLTQEKMHTPQPMTPEGPIQITSGDIVFILEKLLPRRASGPADVNEVQQMLEERLKKRSKDQARRRAKTKANRPPLMPDEDISTR